MTDRLKLERILTNLVHNAVKFTAAGKVQLGVDGGDDSVRLWVADTGQGISEEHHGQLFQEFYQTANPERDRRKGFGLGLAIAGRLVAQLGGRIELDTSLGRGSRFTVALPQALGQSLPKNQPANTHG